MDLKSQAGVAASGSYKNYLALFDEGSPQEWIDTQRDILEVWIQNSITASVDRMAVIKAVFSGESLTTLEAAVIDGSKSDDAGSALELTM